MFTSAIYRHLDSRRTGRSPTLNRLLRRRIKDGWPAYLQVRPRLKRLMVQQRARGDVTARIRNDGLLGPGIRLGNGDFLLAPKNEISDKEAPLRRGRRFNKPYGPKAMSQLPRLHRFGEGHERAGQLVLLRPRRRRAL